MILQGPADADHFRVKVGRYNERWYTDPLDGCSIADASTAVFPSFTTVKKASGADWSFVALGRAADDLFEHPELYCWDDSTGKLIAYSRDSIYNRLKFANDFGLKVAGGRGTIVHWWFEDGLAGRPFRKVGQFTDLPAEAIAAAERFRPAVEQFFLAYEPELILSEVVIIDRDLNGVGYGCTADAAIRIGRGKHKGETFWADWKSRASADKHGIYPEEAMQVGGATQGQYAIVEGTEGPERIPIPQLDGAIIVSVAPEGCRIYPVEIVKATEHFHAAHAWWKARRAERETYGRVWAPVKVPSDTGSDDAASTVTPAGEGAAEGGTAAAVPGPPSAAAIVGAGDGVLEELVAGAVAHLYAPLDTEARLDACRARLADLCEADQEKFWELVDSTGLDTKNPDQVESAIDAVDPFAASAATVPPDASGSRVPAADPVPVLPRPGNEGEPLSDDFFDQLIVYFEALPEEDKDWFFDIEEGARNAGVSFNASKSSGVRNERRWEIYRGLIQLARWGAKDQVIPLLREALGLPRASKAVWGVSLGRLVGALDADQAKHFAELASATAPA